MNRLGILFLCCIPLSASLAIDERAKFGGLHLTGWAWMGLLACGVWLLAYELAQKRPWVVASAWIGWVIWFGYLFLSVIWAEPFSSRNIQDAVQISMPLMVAVAAATFIRTEADLSRLFRACLVTGVVLALVVGATRLGWIRGGEQNNDRAMALSLVVLGCVSLGGLPERIWEPLVGWGACVTLCIITGSRTAAFTLAALPIVHPRLRGLSWRAAAAALGLVLGYIAFYSPWFQERFFVSGHGTLTDVMHGDFLDFGRFDAWPHIFKRAAEAPYFGWGVGSSHDFVPKVWPDMEHVHNDYLRAWFELGAVGVALGALAIIWQLIDARRWTRDARGGAARSFAAAQLAMIAMLIVACTDNPLGYNLWVTNLIGCLLGAGYGVASARLHERAAAMLPASGFWRRRQRFPAGFRRRRWAGGEARP